MNRRLVSDILHGLGHRPQEAESGAEALAFLNLGAFDLVLMDINMPGMSGVEVLRRLRGRVGPERATPAIALTSEVSRSKADYLALGYDDYVAKPFTITDLLGALRPYVGPLPLGGDVRPAA
jgi:CheY-like chemotaxis protein